MQTSTLEHIISTPGQPVSLTSERSDDAREHTNGFAIGAGVVAIILIMVMVAAAISCVILRLVQAHMYVYITMMCGISNVLVACDLFL